MAQIRRPKRVTLPDAVYVPPPPAPIPPALVGLVESTWVCFSRELVTFCDSPAPNIVCQACAMLELGESWENFKARTNSAIPKAKFYRDLETAQSGPDEQFARAQAWARKHRER